MYKCSNIKYFSKKTKKQKHDRKNKNKRNILSEYFFLHFMWLKLMQKNKKKIKKKSEYFINP